MATPSSPPPPASRAVKLAAAALVLLMGAGALGAMEWFMRRRSEQRWGFTDAVEQKTFDPDIGGVRMQPNLSTPRLSTNALGYRGPLPPMPKPAGRVRLAFLGASTTFCHEVGSEAATWPHQVWQAVAAAYPQRDVDYLNGAISGWSMPVMRKAFVKDVAALRPDIVFIYEATNALSLDTRALARTQGLVDEAPDATSWLAERSVLYGLLEKNYRVWRRSAAATASAGKLQFDADALSQGYAGELRQLVAEVKATGALPVLITFAPRIRRSLSPEAQAEAMVTTAYYMPYLGVDGALRGFEAYNQRLREVATETGAVLIDDVEAIPADAVHYTDSVHFTEAGAARMAQRVARAALAAPPLTAVLSSTRTATLTP
jgi:lysophospholipase L1-like esterase